MNIKFLAALTAALTLISVAEAERPTLNIYYVKSDISLPLDKVSQLNKWLKASMKADFKSKVRLRIRGIEQQKVFPFGPTLSLFSHYYQRVYYYHRIWRGNRKRWAAVYVPPVLDENQNRWMVGMGNNYCWRKYNGLSMALAVVQSHNSLGAERFSHSFFAIMHELGHTLGLDHNYKEPTIMASAVLSLVNNGVSFSEAEQHKGKHCLRGK
jgi:hypothetical protein